jgi:nitrite reductase (NADH) large subunit
VVTNNLNQSQQQQEYSHRPSSIVIVGNGPVGIRAAELILESKLQDSIFIFGDEEAQPYNRVRLSLYLAGSIEKTKLANLVDDPSNRLVHFVGHQVVQIDRQNKFVLTKSGQKYYYTKLVLALGSRPRIPKIANVSLDGVYPFRTFEDAKRLKELKSKAKNIFVIGSGPLGLESAIAMKHPHNNVSLQVREKLLSHEIGAGAQLVLSDYLTAMGILLVKQNPIVRVIGEQKVQAVELANGNTVACDCLIICSGITPNIDLAQRADLKTRHGIVVNKDSLTNDKDIYAIGECSEYQNLTFGVVAPGLAQAKNCVNHLSGNPNRIAVHVESIQVKFGDYTTAHYGQLIGPKVTSYEYINRLKGRYRRLIINDSRLVGAVIVGQWQEQNKIKQAIDNKLEFSEKQLSKFSEKGHIFDDVKQPSVKELPADYLVCLCQSVSRGELSKAITDGCRTVETLGDKTKAGVTCGSCQPLLANLLDEPAANLVMRHQRAILITSILSIVLIVLTVSFEPLEIIETVQFTWHIEKIWFDSFWKKVSGFSLLGLCVIAAALGLRKRWKYLNFGHVDAWRYIHSIVGVIALVMLMVHTGMRMGENLNLILMIVFLAATTTGSLVGVFMAKNHHWSDVKLAKHRLWWSRVHHTLLWMLPPLLGFHILSAYYF